MRPQEHFQYQNGELCCDGVSLSLIAEKAGTPFYLYSADALLESFYQLKKNLKDSMICFAVKSNSNISILRLLSEAGAGVDLVSGGELFRAKRAGVSANQIVFSGVGKTKEEIKEALEYQGKGIFSFNVESASELKLINEVAGSLNKTARVALRFNPDVNPKTHPYISTGLKKNKFGLRRSEILNIAKRIREYPAIDLGGISIHIGSQILSLAPFESSLRILRSLVDDLNPLLPSPLKFVDVGGGLGIQYKNEKPPAPEKYAKLILKYFGKMKVVMEPGRFISGNSGVLVTRVLYRKPRSDKDFLIVDAAMNDLLRPALYGSYHEIVAVTKDSSRPKYKKTDVVGPVCESADCFASGRKLPAGIQENDLLAILSAGAYGFTMASNYNSRPRPPEILVRGGQFTLIRERETYSDLIRGETGGRS